MVEHFYLNQVVLYEGPSLQALVNLDERLREDNRIGMRGRLDENDVSKKTILLVIDKNTASRSHWKGMRPEELGEFGIYKVWRLDGDQLNDRAVKIISTGLSPDWRTPRPERY